MYKLLSVFMLMCYLGCGGIESQEINQHIAECHVKPCKVTICHVPPGNPNNPRTITISCAALKAHLKNHPGDSVGPCPPRCGDGQCNNNETCDTCPDDCGQCPSTCGDGECNGDETCKNCIEDCGQCESQCGDEVCDSNEDCESCPQDCGDCLEIPDGGICEDCVPCDPCNIDPPILDGGVPGDNPDDPVADEETNAIIFAGGCNASNNLIPLQSVLAFLFAFFACLILVRLFSRLGWRFGKTVTLAIVTATLLGFFAASAIAFPTQRLVPAQGGTYGLWNTLDGNISQPYAELLYQYEHRPLRMLDADSKGTVGDIIRGRHSLDVLLGFGIGDRLELGINIPIVLDQIEGNLPLSTDTKLGGGIGDLLFTAKFRAFSYNSLSISLAMLLTLPTATAELGGDHDPTLTPKVIVSTTFGPVDLAANLGIRIRSDQTLQGPGTSEAFIAPEFIASAGARWRIHSGKDLGISFISDIYGSTPFRNIDWQQAPIEWINGFALNLTQGLEVRMGAGWGFTNGIGNPVIRGLLGLGWTWETPVKCVKPTKPIVASCPECKPQRVPVPIPIPVPPPIMQLAPVYFDFDKDTLTTEAKKTLLDNLAVIRSNAESVIVLVWGNTDQRGSDEYNMELSKRRTFAVANFLAERGVAKERIQGGWVGKRKPMVPDADSEMDHARNRRVDIFLSTQSMQQYEERDVPDVIPLIPEADKKRELHIQKSTDQPTQQSASVSE